MACVSFHRVREVRDEIESLLELDIDIGECIATVISERDDAVVFEDDENDEEPEDDEKQESC